MEAELSGVPLDPRPDRSRRGRRAAQAANAPIAQELRRRREALGLTVRQAAERAHVTAAMVSEIERGRRSPSVKRWTKLRHALGIEAPLSLLTRSLSPTEPLEVHLVRLAACLVGSGGHVQLPDLGQALGLSAAAVREQLPLVAQRLAACGLDLVTDGLEVRVAPLAVCMSPLEALGVLGSERRRRALSEEAVIILTYIGWHEVATRREIEHFRGEDCETLLGRLVDADLVAAIRDDAQLGRPNRYRLTITGLRTLGAASPEDLRARLHPHLGALVAGAAADDVLSLDERLAVLTLVAGFDGAELSLIARALRRPQAECAALVSHLVNSGLLTVTADSSGARYSVGLAGAEVLGRDGAAAVRGVAESIELRDTMKRDGAAAPQP